MATRFYYQWTTPDLTPSYDTEWDEIYYDSTPGDQYCSLTTSKDVNDAAEPSMALTGVENADYLIAVAVSDSLAAQTIVGTVKGVTFTWEEDAAMNLCQAMVIKIVTSTGALRGTLYSNFPSAVGHEFDDSSETSRYYPEQNTISSVTCSAGDRIVVELGFRALSTVATGNGWVVVGQNSATDDATYDETTSYGFENPWIEFSHDIVFGTATTTTSVRSGESSVGFIGDEMTWLDILTRIRRFLRDPDKTVWSDAELLQYFNDAALEIAFKTGAIIRVESYNYPPEYEWSYMHDWEAEFVDGTAHQCFTINQANGMVICQPWESAYWLDVEPTGSDGYICTHPWEMALYTQHDAIPIPLHSKFLRAKIMCWDEEAIDPIDEATLAVQDSYYRTRSGTPQNYWRTDEMQYRICLYPHPSPVWDETETYEVLDDDGGMIGDESWLDPRDTGITTDVISTEDCLLAVYEAMPADIEGPDDVSDFARYMVKYVEAATLERAYGADTEGYFPTLRDYWGLRKKIGVEALKTFKRLSLKNRNHRLGGGLSKYERRGPQLPSNYPRI